MLPRIKINYLNGQLGTIPESEDGLFALLFVGFDIPSGLQNMEAYSIRSVADLEAKGFTKDDHTEIYRQVSEFYREAEGGTKVVLVFNDEDTYTTVLTSYAEELLNIVANENLRGLFLYKAGNISDVNTAVKAAQALSEAAADERYSPVFVCLAVYGLDDFSTSANNRVCLLNGSTEEGNTSCPGLMAGRLAIIPVHRNLGRVRDGALKADVMYIMDDVVYPGMAYVADLHDKCHITPRQYVGLSGYYFADDCMACDPTDDYAHLTARRTIDKAYRIAYETLVQFMLDEIEVNEDGTMQNGIIKTWQQAVENAINSRMTAAGELSANDGEGCVCYIDAKQDVLATGTVKVTLKVRPYGYARYIDVDLGFQVNRQ